MEFVPYCFKRAVKKMTNKKKQKHPFSLKIFLQIPNPSVTRLTH
jgi:hypothetical protein